jgi:hypothetical protein
MSGCQLVKVHDFSSFKRNYVCEKEIKSVFEREKMCVWKREGGERERDCKKFIFSCCCEIPTFPAPTHSVSTPQYGSTCAWNRKRRRNIINHTNRTRKRERRMSRMLHSNKTRNRKRNTKNKKHNKAH